MAEKRLALRVYAEGAFHSLRIPEQMTYQGSFHYPPRTTLIGMAGAALGKERYELERLYEELQVGIVLDGMPGKAMDLWRIVKPKKGVRPESTVILRDMIYAPRYWLYFSSTKNQGIIEKLKESFPDPCFALTLGKSDELVLIKAPSIVNLSRAEEWTTYRWTVLPFDYKEWQKNGKCQLEKTDLLQPIRLPQVFQLPKAFETKMERKMRPRRRKDLGFYTHVYEVGVKVNDRGWYDDERCFFLF